MYKWTPTTEGKAFELTETLSPLEKYRDRLNVISNLCHQSGKGTDAGSEHARSAAIYLTGGAPQRGAVKAGTSVDQIAAAHIDQLAYKYMGLDKNPYANPADVRVMFEISLFSVQGMS